MHLHNIYETCKVTFTMIFKLHHVRLWLKEINNFFLSWTMLVAKVVKQWSKYTFDQGSYLLRARFVFFNSFLKNSLSIICSCCKPRERYSGFWISDHRIEICSRGGSSGRMRAFCPNIRVSNPMKEANFFWLRNAANIFSLAVRLFLIKCNKTVPTLPSSFHQMQILIMESEALGIGLKVT